MYMAGVNEDKDKDKALFTLVLKNNKHYLQA